MVVHTLWVLLALGQLPPAGAAEDNGAPAAQPQAETQPAVAVPLDQKLLDAPPSLVTPVAPAPDAAVLELDCSLAQARVLMTGGYVLLECPGFQRVELPRGGVVDLLVYVGKLPGRVHSVDVKTAMVTRVTVSNDGGTPRFDTVTRAPDGAPAAPLSSFTVDPQPPPMEAPAAKTVAGAQGDNWKKTTAGLLTVGGAVLVVVGLTAGVTAGTRFLAGNTSSTPYPLPASANTAGWQAFNSATFYAAPVLLVVAAAAIVGGAVMSVAGFVWMRAS